MIFTGFSVVFVRRGGAEEMKKKNIKGNVVLLGSVYGLVGQDPDNYDNTSISENVS